MSKLLLKGKSEVLGIDVVGVKAVGDYSKFVDEVYSPLSSFYDFKNQILYTGKEHYINLLKEGKCVQVNSYLLFIPNKNFEENYLNYAKSYLETKAETDLVESLKDVSSYGMVKTFLKLCKEGSLSKESTISRIKKYFKKEEFIFNYI